MEFIRSRGKETLEKAGKEGTRREKAKSIPKRVEKELKNTLSSFVRGGVWMKF